MKVQAAGTDTGWLTDNLRNLGFSQQSQIDVQAMQVYEVHAIVLWSGNLFYQIVGDSGVIAWIPSGVFIVIEHSMPSDWLANRLDDEVPLVIGPDFLIRDKEAYSHMVELVPEQVAQFKQRLQSLGTAITPDWPHAPVYSSGS